MAAAAIFERGRVVAETLPADRGAGVLDLPLFATEQYRKELEADHAQVAERSRVRAVQLAFSARRHQPPAAYARGDQDVLVCGMRRMSPSTSGARSARTRILRS